MLISSIDGPEHATCGSAAVAPPHDLAIPSTSARRACRMQAFITRAVGRERPFHFLESQRLPALNFRARLRNELKKLRVVAQRQRFPINSLERYNCRHRPIALCQNQYLVAKFRRILSQRT